MCEFSLHHVRSRPAKIGDKLATRDFGLGTRGFAASEDTNMAVCLIPGTELAFANEVKCVFRVFVWGERVINHKTAIFRQVNKDMPCAHQDALEFPNGQIVLLTLLKPDQQATVLQLPASAGAKAKQEIKSAIAC